MKLLELLRRRRSPARGLKNALVVGSPNPARKVRSRTSHELGAEWDRLAPYRESLISSGHDLSYSHVLVPTLRSLAEKWINDGGCVVDVGCGTGHFAHDLAVSYPRSSVVGIDLSEVSIEIARRQRAELPNLEFLPGSIEGFQRSNGLLADVVVANMLFQNVESLPAAIRACRDLLKHDGAMVLAIPHPCFWPWYWGYADEPWFAYGREVWVEARFKTSLDQGAQLTTSHAHRSLEMYSNAFREGGFELDEMSEPMPGENVAAAYPFEWITPRFYLARYRPIGP